MVIRTKDRRCHSLSRSGAAERQAEVAREDGAWVNENVLAWTENHGQISPPDAGQPPGKKPAWARSRAQQGRAIYT